MDFKLNSTQIAEMLNSVTSQIPRPDGSKPLAWDDLTDNQRFHAAKAVEEIYSSPKRSAEELHTLWMAPLVESGWEYGETYDHDNKKHPCMVPFGDLPESEICKDKIWEHLTEAFRPFYDGLKTEDFKNKIDKVELIATLKNCCDGYDPEDAHIEADAALINYIGDYEVEHLFNSIRKWYV